VIEGKGSHAKTRRREADRADFKPVGAVGFQNGDDGHLGGFEALRLIRFVFRGVAGFWRSDRMLAVTREGVLSPHPGLGFHGGTEPSADALGYCLAALRACCHGSLSVGTCGCAGTADTLDVSQRVDSFEEEVGIDLHDVQTDINRLESDVATARARTTGYRDGLRFW
jgi:hypothetical protein